jgi:hypothetical protein
LIQTHQLPNNAAPVAHTAMPNPTVADTPMPSSQAKTNAGPRLRLKQSQSPKCGKIQENLWAGNPEKGGSHQFEAASRRSGGTEPALASVYNCGRTSLGGQMQEYLKDFTG